MCRKRADAPITRIRAVAASVSLLMLLTMFSPRAIAQPTTGEICISAFADPERRGQRTITADNLADINFELLVDSSLVFANYITNGNEPHCFSNLPPGQYGLRFNSASYEAVDELPLRLDLTAGGRIIRDVAMIEKPAPVAEVSPILYVPLTQPVRIGLSLGASLFVMMIFGALGLVFYGIFVFPRPQKPKYPQLRNPRKHSAARETGQSQTDVTPPWERQMTPADFDLHSGRPLTRGQTPIDLDDEDEL